MLLCAFFLSVVTPSLVPASTLLSPTVADFPATFPASTSPTDFFIHTLMWKAGVESSYLNGTLIGSRVLPAASAFAAIPSSDTSFAINSGLPVANLALAKRLNPSASYSDFNSSLDLNTGCGGDIEVAAVLLYNRALMDPERDIVTGYLASKYFGASSGFGNTDASYPERIGGGNALQTRIQAVNGSIVSRVVPTRLELVGEGFGRSASDLTGAGVTFGPVSGQEYVCDSALWSNSTALICTLSPSVLKSSDLSLSMKFVGWINWKPSVASVSLLTFAPATVANSFQVTGTTAATKLPEGSFLKLEVRTMLSLTAAVNLAVSVSSSGSGAAAPRLPTVVSPASGIVEFPLRAAWSPASIAEISVYAGWCTVSGGSGASCVLTVSFAISGPNPQSLVAPSDVVVTVSGAPFSTAVISAIYATAGDKYGCENGVTARDLDVTLADTARRMHFCSSLRVAALSASWIEFDIWPQLSGLAKTAMLSLTPSAVLGGAGALSLTVSWTKTFDSVASSFAVKPAPYSATTQTISVNAVLTAQSFDIATVINDALGSAQAQSSSPPLRVTIQLAYNSGSDLQFDVDAVKMDIVWSQCCGSHRATLVSRSPRFAAHVMLLLLLLSWCSVLSERGHLPAGSVPQSAVSSPYSHLQWSLPCRCGSQCEPELGLDGIVTRSLLHQSDPREQQQHRATSRRHRVVPNLLLRPWSANTCEHGFQCERHGCAVGFACERCVVCIYAQRSAGPKRAVVCVRESVDSRHPRQQTRLWPGR